MKAPTRKRPRLLYIAYYFRPAEMIACVRTWNTAVHLSRLGWDVLVVTPDPTLWKQASPEQALIVEHQLRHAGIKRLATGHGWRMLVNGEMKYPSDRLSWFVGGICRRIAAAFQIESHAGWYRSALRACNGLRRGEIDCILATGSPYVSFRVAERLGRRLCAPFVLDYRDPWSGNPHAAGPDLQRDVEDERRILQSAAAVSVVSRSWAALLSQRFGVGAKTHVVSNGYDPSMFQDVVATEFDHFAVVYAGTLYRPKRVLDPVLKAFEAARKLAARPMRFHYFGSYGNEVSEQARAMGIEEWVDVHGQVSREEALAAQKGAGVLVVIASVEERGTQADNGIVTGKIFDGLALERPALVVAPHGSDMYGIAEATGGMRCFAGSDVRGMTDFLVGCSSGFEPPRRAPEQYQWSVIGHALNRVVRAVIGQAAAGTASNA